MTGFETSPLLFRLSTHIPSQPGDSLLNAWILAWDFHALINHPWSLFHANIFYPAPNTLALSEHMLGVLPIFAPVYALTGNPIAAYNVVFFLSFVLSGVTMFLFVFHWTQHFWAALVAGFLFAFAPIRFEQFGHIQLLNLYWAPIALLYLEKFLRNKNWRDLAGFSIFYWLQVLSSVYLGWFTTIAVAVYVSYNALCIDRTLLKRAMISRYAAFAAFSLLILLPLHFPYYQIKQQWDISSSLQQCIYYSSDLLLSYVTVPDFMNDLYFVIFGRGSESNLYEKVLFPSLVLPLLIVLGSALRRGVPLGARLRYISRSCWAVLVSSFLLSLGPYLIILGKNTHIPLPYLLLYHLLPGFQAMRVPARFGFMMMLAGSVLASLGFLRLCRVLSTHRRTRKLRTPAWHAVLTLLCLGLFSWELGGKPLQLTRIPTGHEVPEVYRWLAAEEPGPLIELPAGMWENFMYEYFSTYHWLPIVNGASGYAPPTYGQILRQLQPFPTREGIAFLSAIGVKWVVVHFDQLQPHETLQWHQAPLEDWGVEKVAEFGPDIVYRIPLVDVTDELRIELAAPNRLPIKTRVRLGLLARSVVHRMWTSPEPPGRVSAIVDWVQQGTGKRIVARESFEMPLAIRAEQVIPLGLPVRTPASPGHYLLTVQVPVLGTKTPPWQVELTTDPFPTSLHNPQLLSAAYAWEGPQPHVIMDHPLPIALRAINAGRATWLAQSEDGKGAVRLGWRWYRGDQEISYPGGRELLKYDVFPGGEVTFHTQITPPLESDNYILELGLVSELVTWFSDLGVEPLKVAVRMAHSGHNRFEQLLAMPMKGIDNPPKIAITTDQPRYRHGHHLHMIITGGNPDHAHIVDAYLAFAWPDGRIFFHDHNGVLRESGGPWIPLAKGLLLAKGLQLNNRPLMELHLVDMPYGSYTCYLILTEPNAYKIITKAETLFTLEP
jgi:hypothetical protein